MTLPSFITFGPGTDSLVALFSVLLTVAPDSFVRAIRRGPKAARLLILLCLLETAAEAQALGLRGIVRLQLGQKAEARRDFAECLRLDAAFRPSLEKLICGSGKVCAL